MRERHLNLARALAEPEAHHPILLAKIKNRGVQQIFETRSLRQPLATRGIQHLHRRAVAHHPAVIDSDHAFAKCVYILAAVAILFWAFVGRKYESGTARDLSWIFAASQAIAVLVPATLHIFKLLAIGVIVIAAVVGLVILFTDRGHEKT